VHDRDVKMKRHESPRAATKDVPARGVVIGVPGRVVREVGDEDLLERWR
jgi:hypothetical protein